jgi:hypothetical protein
MKRVPLFVFFLLFATLTILSAAPIEFTAEVKDIDIDEGKIYFALADSFTAAVWVTEKTEIRDKNGEPLGLADLGIGMVLKVEGRSTEGGILALEIKIVENLSEFELKGPIQSVDTGARRLVLLGFSVQVPEEAKIKGAQGRSLDFEALSPDLWVKVEGIIDDRQMIATEIHVRQAGVFRANVNLEGIILEIEDSTLTVGQQGGTSAVVRVSLATIVKGTLQVGALVRVHGWLAEDLAVEARQIIVQSLIMAVPQRIKMDVNQERRVQVVLRTALEDDAILIIEPANGLVSTPDTLTIPAGSSNGFFLIQSSTETGSTTIAISMPEGLGGASTQVAVVVGDKIPDPAQKVSQLRFAPAKLHIPASQTRLVRLHVNRVVSSPLTIALDLVGEDSGLLVFPDEVTIPAGSNGIQLEVTAAQTAGTAVIRAVSEAEGLSVDLEVEVRVIGPQNQGRSGR